MPVIVTGRSKLLRTTTVISAGQPYWRAPATGFWLSVSVACLPVKLPIQTAPEPIVSFIGAVSVGTLSVTPGHEAGGGSSASADDGAAVGVGPDAPFKTVSVGMLLTFTLPA